METLFDIPPVEDRNPFINETCRNCIHREGWYLNYYSSRTTQHCNLQPTRRNRTGFKRIKVTDTACANFEPKKKE